MLGQTSGERSLYYCDASALMAGTRGAVIRKRRYGTSWVIASTLVILLAPINLAGCRQATSQVDPRTLPPLVELATVRSPEASRRAFTGVVVARVQSNLGFRVGGKIVERMVDTGAFVRRGQPLMRIDRNDLALAIAARDAAVASAKARAIQTAADEARYATLLRAEVTTPQLYDQAKAAADTARAQLHQAYAEARVAENEGGYAVLTADADGVVADTLAEPGQVVAAGQTVIKLAHDGPREAAIYLPETLHPVLCSRVRATLFGETDSVPAWLRQLSDAADPQTRTFEARYVLEGSAATAPLGATVTVELPSSESNEALQIPISSIIDRGKGPGVWVFNEKSSTVSFRAVRALRLGEEDALVQNGVRSGERIVALGTHLLSDGQQVRIADQAAAFH
jgi:RND family efflux transporter MFP subunit